MPVKTEYRDDILTARLQGEIDHHTAAAMRETIDRTAEGCLPSRLVLDFSEKMEKSHAHLCMAQLVEKPAPAIKPEQVFGL